MTWNGYSGSQSLTFLIYSMWRTILTSSGFEKEDDVCGSAGVFLLCCSSKPQSPLYLSSLPTFQIPKPSPTPQSTNSSWNLEDQNVLYPPYVLSTYFMSLDVRSVSCPLSANWKCAFSHFHSFNHCGYMREVTFILFYCAQLKGLRRSVCAQQGLRLGWVTGHLLVAW
jgi:hypothetical protein